MRKLWLVAAVGAAALSTIGGSARATAPPIGKLPPGPVTTIVTYTQELVAISMVGLGNAITMSVIERTREIGILRTIGARARDVRRIFAAESVVIALVGWLIGIPVGYLLDRFLVWMLKEVVNVQIPLVFPLANVAWALVGTIVLALLITLLPIRRAVRYRPGEALRYA